MLNEFIEYLESQVNVGIYVWARQGQIATEASIQASKNTQTNKNYAIKMMKERQAKGLLVRMFDCSGLGMYWIDNLMELSPDRSSRGMYADCPKKLKREEVKRGDWVFKGTPISHVGYCVDDNQNIIHAKASKYGVIKEHISKSTWTRYGRPKWFIEEIENEKEEETVIVYVNGTKVATLEGGDELTMKVDEVVVPPQPVLKKVVYTGTGASIRTAPKSTATKMGTARNGDVFETNANTIDSPYTEIVYQGKVAYAYNKDGNFFNWA